MSGFIERFSSIRTQIALTVLFFSLLVVVIIFILIMIVTHDQLKQQKISSIKGEIYAYNLVISNQMSDFNYVAVDRLVRVLTKSPNIDAIQVENEFGQEVSRSHKNLPVSELRFFQQDLLEEKGSTRVGVLKIWWTMPDKLVDINAIFIQLIFYILLSMILLSLSIYRVLAFSIVKPLSQLEKRLNVFTPGASFECSPWLSKEIRSLQEKYMRMEGRIYKQMKNLKKLASTDTLTDLPNRQQMEKIIQERLVVAEQKGQSFSVLFLDVDHFKQINDVYGHDVGDQALKAFSGMIETCMVEKLEVLGRFGGDEFVLVAFEAYRVPDMIRKIYERLDREFVLAGRRLYLSTSIGVANWPGAGKTYKELLKSADIALYKSKRNGRNQATFFSQQMQLEVNQWAKEMDTLKSAMKQNRFICYWQAVVNASGEIAWHELLIRLVTEDGSILSADEFLPSAEESGLMGSVAEFTCQGSLDLLKSGKVVNYISINFSRSQLLLPALNRMLQPLMKWRHKIIIEVTEEAFMGGEQVRSILVDLRDKGFTIALDDFGSGFSSLAMLLELPVDIVKLDKEFQTNIHQRDDARTMLGGIISMLHSLGKSVVAEGIQNVSQYEFAISSDCNYLQGYYFHRPVKVGVESIHSVSNSYKQAWE